MRDKVEFTSYLTQVEKIQAIGYLPMHTVILPLLIGVAINMGRVSLAEGNMLVYAIGLIYMVCFMPKFLRREFDAFCDRPVLCFKEIAISYGLILACNLLVNGALLLIGFGKNPNNSTVLDLVEDTTGNMSAAVLFMAPVIEEIMFRGGIFSTLYKKSRFIAYVMTVGFFSLYHVWGYAILNPWNWVYLLQYIPVSYLICRCYERTNSIWASILLHVINNGVALVAANLLGGLV